MSGERDGGAGASAPLPGPRLASAGWALLTIAALLALVDLAIETWWRGSPLRWWVSPAALIFVLLSLWLWKPGESAARRWGWAGAAAWSVGVLLLLVAVSSWLPDGQTNGVRMLRQPTTSVLTLVTAAAVALAAFVLFRVLARFPSGSRRAARGVVIALAIYAVASLGLALYERTPFSALFQGGAAWQRLPRWLQGAFVGAFALMPMALLGQAVLIIGRIARRQSVRVLLHQTTALVMAMVMCVSGLPVHPVSPPPVQTPALGSPATIDTSLLSLNRLRADFANRLVTPIKASATTVRDESARIDSLYSGIAELSRSVPRETFDVAAVAARVGPDPINLFEWVRDNTSFLPYRGVLRGPTGVLMDRRGNSLDRALLLGRLLKTARLESRLAHGSLSPAQAQALVAVTRGTRPVSSTDDDATAVLARLSPVIGTDAVALRQGTEAVAQAASTFTAAVRAQADAQATALLAAVGPQRRRATTTPEQASTDHWWVQIWRDRAWFDLDPSVPSGQPGDTLTSAVETIRPDALPAGLYHRVDISLVVEQRLDGHLREQVALSAALRPADLVGQTVTLAQLPLGIEPTPDLVRLDAGLRQRLASAATQEVLWLPVLSVGNHVVTQKLVSTSGQTEDFPAGALQGEAGGAPAASAGGVAGFLGGGSQVQQPPALDLAKLRSTLTQGGDLTAEWIDYKVTVPGGEDRTIRREVFDLLGPAARKSSIDSRALTDGERLTRGLALLSETEVLLLGGRMSLSYVTSRRLQTWLDNRKPLESLLRARGSQDDARMLDSLASMSSPPGPLFDLALMRNSATAEPDATFLGEPNILSFHTGLRGSNLTEIGGFSAFDIVWNQVEVRDSSASDSFAARLRHGVYDSVAEAAVLRRGCCGVESSVVSGAIADVGGPASGWNTLRTFDDLDRMAVSPEIRERIAVDLRSGYLVVASKAPAAQSGWWRIDPSTGRTVYIGSRGWGQALADLALHLKRIGAAHVPAWLTVVTKLVALGVCLATSISGPMAGGPTHSTAANVGIATVGAGICLAAAAFGIGSMNMADDASVVARIIAAIAETLGMGTELAYLWAEHSEKATEATRTGVEEKK